MSKKLLPTSLVGSYPQPDWLIDRAQLSHRLPPRVRATDLWRVSPEFLEEAQDDATVLAIRAQERAGLDIITDGEIRRESYSNRFATALEGIDLDNPAQVVARSGKLNYVPRIVSKIRRKHAVEVRDIQFLRANTDRRVQATVTGKIKGRSAPGCDIVQIDEPYMQAVPDKARQFGLKALSRALEGVQGETAIHLCFGYAAMVANRPSEYQFLAELADAPVNCISIETAQSSLDCSVLARLTGKNIILGVLDLSSNEVETPEKVAARIRRALPYISADRLIVAPDCGMKYLPRDVAFGKLQAMVAGAGLVRTELGDRQLVSQTA